MNSCLEFTEQLAAPVEPQTVGPALWTRAFVSHEELESSAEATASFLITAAADAETHSESPVAWARLAQAAQSAGDTQAAGDAASMALRLGVTYTSAPSVQAATIVLAGLNRIEELQQAIRDPRMSDLPLAVRARAGIAAGDLDYAFDQVADSQAPSDLPMRAWLHLERREFHDAVRTIRHAAQEGVTGPALLVNLGYAHAAIGNLHKAIRVTRQAAALAPADRTIGLNLAGYRRTLNDFEGALDEISRLAELGHLDVELGLAKADTLAAAGKEQEAFRVLTRLRTSVEWATASRVSRSELDANLALLRWFTNREKDEAALRSIQRALEDCDYQSLAIAAMLPNLMRKPAQAGELRRVVEKLAERHRAEDLFGLRTQLAVLEHDAENAVQFAAAWAKHDPLNPFAAAIAVHLLADLVGDYTQAAEVGVTAARRHPHHLLLINNTAYALALSGQATAAREMIALAGQDAETNVALTATRALADLVSGDMSSGVAGYQRAQELALESGDDFLAQLVSFNAAMAMQAVGTDPYLNTSAAGVFAELSDEWANSPSFWAAAHRLRRDMARHSAQSDEHV
jgi:tetratricopeptide (TPR) repeat protein